MASPTLYVDIYDIFMSQYTDEIFNNIDFNDSLKKRYLLNAIPRFRHCNQDLSNRNDTTNTFNITLTDEEKLIIGVLMVAEYLKPMITSIDLMKQQMSSKDFRLTSQAEHLKRLMELRESVEKDAKQLMIEYSYSTGNLSDLK